MPKKAKKGIIAFYYLYNDVVIDGKPYNKTIKIGVDNKGNLFYILLLDDNNGSQNGETETKSSATLRATNITISQSDENVKFEQRAYSGEFSQLRNLPKKKKTIKGEFSVLEKSIDFTKDADFSTLPHEFAHFWLDNIWNYVESGLASKEYLEQFNEVRKFLGLKKEWGMFFLIKRKSY